MVKEETVQSPTSGKRAKKPPRSKGDLVFNIVLYFVLTLVSVVMLYPLLYMLSVSLSSRQYVSEIVLWPKGITLDAYKYVFQYELTLSGYGNSLLYTVLGTIISLFLTTCAAYPISKYWLPGRKIIVIFFLITMYFSGGLIPQYIIIRHVLGLYNSIFAIVIPGALNTSYVVIMVTFIRSLPEELDEAAYIDGANEVRVLWSVKLPLLTPILATLTLFYAVAMWNSWFGPFIYLEDESKYPIQLVLRNLMVSFSVDTGQVGGINGNDQLDPTSFNYALTVAVILPILVIYPFIQKFFEQGMMVGSLKG